LPLSRLFDPSGTYSPGGAFFSSDRRLEFYRVTRKLLRVNPLDRSFLFVGVLFLKTSRGAIIKTLSKTVDE
jgi:hypothetical protein